MQRAGTRIWDDPCQLGPTLAHLSATVDALNSLLTSIGVQLGDTTRYSQIAIVDGPFINETTEALTTARHWLSRAVVDLDSGRNFIDNAHVSLGGLADTGP